jgi:hypothetical protein
MKYRVQSFRCGTGIQNTSRPPQLVVNSKHNANSNSEKPEIYLYQGYTKPGRQISRTNTFCTVVPNICFSSVMELVEFNPIDAENFEVVSRNF